MTRINCISPHHLTNEHLIAEYRELPRVFGLVLKAMERGERAEEMPRSYTMGSGHVRFFYPRLTYVAKRFFRLVGEMDNRTITANYRTLPPASEKIPIYWWEDWHPDKDAIRANLERLKSKNEEYAFLNAEYGV